MSVEDYEKGEPYGSPWVLSSQQSDAGEASEIADVVE